MATEVRPVTVFEDVRTTVGPKRSTRTSAGASVIGSPARRTEALSGTARGHRVAELVAESGPPGVLVHDGDEWRSIPAYPVDDRGETAELTTAYGGTEAIFEAAGFVQAATITTVLSGFDRVLMRFDLRER